MLKNLNVRNYNRFGDLQFTDFRRVNLLTGKNKCAKSGKTSVREAILLLLDWQRSSDEFVKVFRPGKGQNLENERENFWRWLFPCATYSKHRESPVRSRGLVIMLSN